MKINFCRCRAAPPPQKKALLTEFSKCKWYQLERSAHSRFCLLLMPGMKSTTPEAAHSWRPRPSPGQQLPTGEACLLGQPGCQVASLPAGWATSNQGCGAQLELPTSALLALGWLKAKPCSVCTQAEWPWDEGDLRRPEAPNEKG